ncbi:hypothetical protein EJ06DRAFT_567156, partial [Trichodelitschia bisporula]
LSQSPDTEPQLPKQSQPSHHNVIANTTTAFSPSLHSLASPQTNPTDNTILQFPNTDLHSRQPPSLLPPPKPIQPCAQPYPSSASPATNATQSSPPSAPSRIRPITSPPKSASSANTYCAGPAGSAFARAVDRELKDSSRCGVDHIWSGRLERRLSRQSSGRRRRMGTRGDHWRKKWGSGIQRRDQRMMSRVMSRRTGMGRRPGA